MDKADGVDRKTLPLMTGSALRPLGRRDDGLGFRCIWGEDQVVFPTQNLGDENRMLVLPAVIEMHGTEGRRAQTEVVDSVADLGSLERLGVIHGLRGGQQG